MGDFGDKLCRRLMTVPGVGPMVALTFRATVDQAQRFARSKAVGAHFGLAPRRCATCTPQALSQDHVRVRVRSTCAAS